MSIAVEIADLPGVIAERGPAAFLVSQGDGRPRVVSVTASWSDGAVVVGAGRRTSANVASRPEVTLLWPPGPSDAEHSLLIDGTATVAVDGEQIAVVPEGAVLHRSRT